MRPLPKSLSYHPRRDAATAILARVAWQGKIHPRSFAFSIHGGEQGAIIIAALWRDVKEIALGKPRSERTVQSLSRRNRSGELGIREGEGYVEATWTPTPGGCPTRTKISSRIRSVEEAREIARERRAVGHARALEAANG